MDKNIDTFQFIVYNKKHRSVSKRLEKGSKEVEYDKN
jgi:hypothetical protein